MKREIKFRAWDTRTQKMIATGFHVIGEVTMFRVIERFCYENLDKDECTLERLEDIVVMEFTGLHDSAGKGIYEGDIIKYYDGKLGIVQWMTEADGYDMTGWVTSNSNYNCTENGNFVIGNIYENPELIGG